MRRSLILSLLILAMAITSAVAQNIDQVPLIPDGFIQAPQFAQEFRGGFSEQEYEIDTVTHGGVLWCKIDIDHPDGPADTILNIWLSDNGHGGNVQIYQISMPDSVIIPWGTASVEQESWVLYCYNAGTPVLDTCLNNPLHANSGEVLDSCIILAKFVTLDDWVSSASAWQSYMYKDIQRLAVSGDRMEYHQGVDPTVAAGGQAVSFSGGWLHKLQNIRVPAIGNRATSDTVRPFIVPVFADSSGYAIFDSIAGIADYADGSSVLSNHRVWVAWWATGSDVSPLHYKLYMNIQNGTNTYITNAAAEKDEWNMKPLDIPEAYSETGFLIAAAIYHRAGDSLITLTDGTKFRDFRKAIGGGGSAGATVDSAIVDGWISPVISDSLSEYMLKDESNREDSMLSRSFAIFDITDTRDLPLWKVPYAFTLRAVMAKCEDGTNVVGQLQEYNAAGASPADVHSSDRTITQSQDSTSTFSNADIDQYDWLGWKTTSVSGTVTRFVVTFWYTKD